MINTLSKQNENFIERFFGLLSIFLIVFFGDFINLYIIYALILLSMVLIVRRFVINKKENKSNLNIFLFIIFLILFFLIDFFV